MQFLACSLILLAADIPAPLQARVAQIESRYDTAATLELVEQLRTDHDADSILAEALLVLAELYRVDFEALDESARIERRNVGKQIDALADEALGIVDTLAKSSRTQRLTADLLGVKIRSNYQAKKYRKRMERASSRAIELDPYNAAAYVSAAKPFLFAGENHRGDIGHAIELLKTAIGLDPDLEKARLLMALAYEKNGDVNLAEQAYDSILESNPNCRPARDALARLRSATAEGSP